MHYIATRVEKHPDISNVLQDSQQLKLSMYGLDASALSVSANFQPSLLHQLI